jgi:hypothetical protein
MTVVARPGGGVGASFVLRDRLPPWNQILSVLGVVVFAVHSWSVRGFLYNVPSFILKYRAGEIFVIFCYHMAFAFVESAVIAACLVALAGLLPLRWMRYAFVSKSFLLVLGASTAAIILQFNFAYGMFYPWTSNRLLLAAEVASGVLLSIGMYVWADRAARLQRLIESVVDQISIMLFIYLPLDAVGLAVVAWRLLR